MKIDIYSHVISPRFLESYRKRIGELDSAPRSPYQRKGNVKERYDINLRIGILNKFPGLAQVLTPTRHSWQKHAKPDDAVYLAKIYNDDMAELVLKYPDKFITAVACLPLKNINASLDEIDRVINDLGFKGIAIGTPENGQPLDSPHLLPIYEKMADYDLPIWIHPVREYDDPDYQNEDVSKYGLFQVFGWPYETTLAMARLVCSGLMGKYPNIKFVTHHAGAMISFLAGRIHMLECTYDYMDKDREPVLHEKSPVKFFKQFYNDTALYGNTPGLMCAHEFFGTDHMVFGTDLPYGPGFGETYTRLAIEAVEKMNVSDSDKQKIFADNAKKLLHLD
jgi:predicted TIM-barrel fold metal-dependent hydrolase